MKNNYLLIALRNILKRKGYAFLNIAGLAIGMACCLLLFQYVAYEKSYDTFEKNADNIVRLRVDAYQRGKLSWQSATVYPAIAPTIKKDFPEVENFCRLIDANLLISNDDRNIRYNERQGYFADTAFISMFDLNVKEGGGPNSLEGPRKMMISETMAKKYFGDEDPLGKKLMIRDTRFTDAYEITGVFKDFPGNSHFVVNYLVSYSTLGAILRAQGDTTNASETSWGWYDYYAYLQLKPGTDYKKLEAKLPAFTDRYMNSREVARTRNFRNELYLIPLSDIHLYSNFNQEAEVNGNGQSVSFIFLIAFLIIFIAWINYINLATSRSVERAREIGVRKVLGAARRNLIQQFMMESFLINLFALFIAIIIFFVASPAFNHLIGRSTDVIYSMPFSYWSGFISLFLLGTFLLGLYPAFVISGFAPVSVLKGAFKTSNRGAGLRKGLIIGQFVTSLVLIAGTIIVFQQVNYMRNQKLGFNMAQTVVLQAPQTLPDSVYLGVFQPFRNEVMHIQNVKSISSSTNVMGQEDYWTNGYVKVDEADNNSLTLYNLGVDYDFIHDYDLHVVAGRTFSKDFGTDSSAVLLNETAIERLGYTKAEDALQKRITAGGDTFHVIGVLSNFHQQGLQKAIEPMCFQLRPRIGNFYSIKLDAADVHQTIASIQASWNRFFPNDPFDYFFLDENFNQQYASNELFGKVFGLFAFLAILIACFGLMGLTAYSVAQRTKEIGVRKVLGASVQNILSMVSKDFLKLILIAIVIAVPLAFLVMQRWLQDFAYRVNIQWWVFVCAGIIALVIAIITISLQAMKAAIANPVKSLRTE
ncbi:MAG TPA: ABC transporter permease [Chitinophagales bacterium]|nr:ABC transporter permease [Chitinophagales bacterium]